ncbi:MAG: DUF1684 domain-containing protein [Bacteroidota bacterium]
MKKFILIILVLSFSILQSQNKNETLKKDVEKFQNKLNEEFKDELKSPLTEEDIKTFKALDFFEIDTTFRVIAKLELIKDSKPFKMQTTTDRLPIYKIFAKASFKINGKAFVLPIYQNQKLVLSTDYENYLFLPFTDLTNGKSSYGGGRYIDLKIPKGDTIIIDFNKSYNPYCAYNGKYSCPIPPEANHLNIAINAGVKNYNKEH